MTELQIAKQASIREKRTLHRKLRAKAKAKKAPMDASVSQSQDAHVEESLGNELLERTKAGAIASPKETNEGRKKAAKSKLHDMKEWIYRPNDHRNLRERSVRSYRDLCSAADSTTVAG